MNNLANKSFKDNTTGEIIRVIDSFDNIAILENKQRVDVRRLMDSNLYTEQIDAKNFFNTQSAYNSLAEKIKSIPMENIIDDDGKAEVTIRDGVSLPGTNESAIIVSSLDDERAELAKKYGVIDNKSSMQTQNEAFSKLLDEDELPRIQQPNQVIIDEPKVQHIEAQRENDTNKVLHLNNLSIQPPTIRVEAVDPITSMFKGVKRNVNFKMSVEISNKIPRLDFIEMMEDSYEVSIIDFLAEEFTQNILKDPSKIKEIIKDRIKKIVYGLEVSKEAEVDTIDEKPKKVVKKVAKKAPEKPTPPTTRHIKEGKDPQKPKS